MFLQHVFSLAVAATLSTCMKLKRSDDGLSSISEHFERSNKALEARADYVTERGTIIGVASDTLGTYGLSTCVGMVAVGEAGPAGTNKVRLGDLSQPPVKSFP